MKLNARFFIRFFILVGLLIPVGGLASNMLQTNGENDVYLPLIQSDQKKSWKEVGEGSATGSGISGNLRYEFTEYPDIAFAPDGTPYIVWQAGLTHIYVKRWNGNQWEEVGVGSASGGGIDNEPDYEYNWYPSIAIGSNSMPYVAWDNGGSFLNAIYIRRYNGSEWEEVGVGSASGAGISDNSSGIVSSPSIALTPDDTPYVTWHYWTYGLTGIYVKRWNGSEWEEVGTNSANGTGINDANNAGNPCIAIAPDGRPYVVWSTYGDIYVKRFNGSAWEEVGAGSASGNGISNTETTSNSPSIAIDSHGIPYIAWREEWRDNTDFESRIYVRRWNGASWEEVGTGSAIGDGISSGQHYAYSPSIAIAPDDTPLIAWDRRDIDGLYVKYWNGVSWDEYGVDPTSGYGIGSGNDPVLAIAPDNIPYIVWGYYSYNTDSVIGCDIYVRRYK